MIPATTMIPPRIARATELFVPISTTFPLRPPATSNPPMMMFGTPRFISLIPIPYPLSLCPLSLVTLSRYPYPLSLIRYPRRRRRPPYPSGGVHTGASTSSLVVLGRHRSGDVQSASVQQSCRQAFSTQCPLRQLSPSSLQAEPFGELPVVRGTQARVTAPPNPPTRPQPVPAGHALVLQHSAAHCPTPGDVSAQTPLWHCLPSTQPAP